MLVRLRVLEARGAESSDHRLRRPEAVDRRRKVLDGPLVVSVAEDQASPGAEHAVELDERLLESLPEVERVDRERLVETLVRPGQELCGLSTSVARPRVARGEGDVCSRTAADVEHPRALSAGLYDPLGLAELG